MVFNRIHGGGKASVSIVNGQPEWILAMEGLAVGMEEEIYEVGLDETGAGALENIVAGGYRYYYAGLAGGDVKAVRLYSGHNVLDLSK